MTLWALALLILYVTLALSRVGTVKAAQLSVVVTLLVVSAVLVGGGG